MLPNLFGGRNDNNNIEFDPVPDRATPAPADNTGIEVAPVGSDEDVIITLENVSGTDVCYVYISPSGADDWGDDWLGSQDVVQSGEQIDVTLDAGIYDFQARDCDENVLSEEFEVDLADGEVISWPIE